MAVPASWTHGASLPVLAEVCLAKFPYEELPDAPGPKAHPVLILAIQRADPFSLFVAYGSSKKIEYAHPWDLVLSKDEAEKVGLDSATRFHLSKCAWLIYDGTWFQRPTGFLTPRIGALPNGARQRLSECRIAWELAHGKSLIPGKEPVATLMPPAPP